MPRLTRAAGSGPVRSRTTLLSLKVGTFAVGVEQNVAGFDIAVDELGGVQILEDLAELVGHEADVRRPEHVLAE